MQANMGFKTQIPKYAAILAVMALMVESVVFGVSPKSVAALTTDDQIAALNQKIAEYQAQLKKIGSDKKTLQSAIKTLDLQRAQVEAQVQVNQHQIQTTETQINDLNSQVDSTQKTIESNKQLLAEYMREMKQHEDQPLILRLISAQTFSDFWADIEAVTKITDLLHKKSEELQDQQNRLKIAQASLQQHETELSAQNDDLKDNQHSLNNTISSKSDLLSQTKNKEGEYQKLLANAKKQLDSFSAFTKNAGGSGLVGTQTVCDSWGCYYNQRDSAWGGQALNGTGYTLASDGCLVTSVAMVMTHYGYKKVTPASINSNPANFASYYPAYLMYTVSSGGGTATRKSADIDSTLAGGDPVIVGLNVKGGTHFVVLVSGSGGNYIMRDPYYSGGKDIPFSTYYSTKSIFSSSRVIVN